MEKVLQDFGLEKVSSIDVFEDIFKIGEGFLQNANEPSGLFKANPVGWFSDGKTYKDKNGKIKQSWKYRIFFEDTYADVLQELQEHKFALFNGISYFGKKNLSSHASKMFAMIFDLDGVNSKTLTNFLHGALNAGHYPVPNYIVLSGHGVHLYYILEYPVNLYPNIKLQLKTLKYKLIERIWNMYTSTEKPQFQGIFQPFRIIGGRTKVDAKIDRSVAYKVASQCNVTIKYLNEFVEEEFRVDDSKLYQENQYTLMEAKKLFPEWYAEVIESGGRKQGRWFVSRNLYDWWLKKIREGARFGHRYFCVMTLAIFAIKCDVSRDEAYAHALELVPYLNSLNTKEPFKISDVDSAFECFDLRYIKFPRHDLEKLTAIAMPANKRNGRRREQHIQIMNFIRDVVNKNTTWNKEGNGRKSKEDIVQEWKKKNPLGRKIDCERETGLSRHTVLKWW